METKISEPVWNRILRFSPGNLWKLFSNAGIFTHIWTFILFLRDFSWVNERNNTWDAIGVGAYGLVTALLESFFVFTILIMIGFLLPRGWSERKRLAILSTMVWVVSSFAIANQLYFLLGNPFPKYIIQLLAASGHPLRFLYLGAVFVVILMLLPLFVAFLKSNRALELFAAAADRVATLMAFYLVIDFISLVIVVIRNFQ